MEHRSRQQIETRAIFILDDAMSRQHGAGMRGMAEPRPGRWGIVDGPFPAGLICCAAKRGVCHVHDFKSAERKLSDLIRLIEYPQNGVCHSAKHIGAAEPAR